MKNTLLFLILLGVSVFGDLPLMYWGEDREINFGDYISLKLIERIVQRPVRFYVKKTKNPEQKMLAIGSILYFANEGDLIWGSGLNGLKTKKEDYSFTHLDVRAVRGPITRRFLMENFHIDCPPIYGDPALLFPYFFPEFKKKEPPQNDYIVIPHYRERKLFPKTDPHVVHPTEPWDQVIEKILDSKFVISSSLHGIIIAESYGIPARWLRVSEIEPMLKYKDYYLGTNRPFYRYAESVEEALQMGGEVSYSCDLQKLYEAFPFEFWPDVEFFYPDFSQEGAR